MTSILSKNKIVPFWGFIVIIVVGSFFVLGIIFVAFKYYLLNRALKSDNISLTGDPETVRKVTVRRGRMVPHSHYMSLTGSKYGIGNFDSTDDQDSMSSPLGRRSKSPMDWWRNSILHQRTSSRQSIMSSRQSFTSHAQRSSVYSTATLEPPQPRIGPSPLRTATSFEVPSVYTFPNKPQPLVRTSSRTTNFSRPALRGGFMNLSHANSLPQIIEASPHTSMISRQSQQSIFTQKAFPSPTLSDNNIPKIDSPHRQSFFSRSSKRSVAKLQSDDQNRSSLVLSETGTKFSPPPLTPVNQGWPSPSLSAGEISSAVSSPGRSMNRQPSQSRIPRPTTKHIAHLHALPRSSSLATVKDDTKPPAKVYLFPRETQSPRQPLPIARAHSRQPSYRCPGDEDHVSGQLSNSSLSALTQLSPTETAQSQPYWDSRTDLQPVRRSNSKGNILRKKSFLQADMGAMLQ